MIWAKVGAYWVDEGMQAFEAGLLIFASFTDLCAYDGFDLRWVTSCPADGIQITGVEGSLLTGLAWDLATDACCRSRSTCAPVATLAATKIAMRLGC